MIGRLAIVVVIAGCALATKSPPIELHYYTLAPPASANLERPPSRARLRLGRVFAAGHLGSAIVHRDSDVELAPYETLRWAESPEVYARRALVHAVFEARPIDQATVGGARTLDVEVVSFEEVARAAGHAGRVELRYELRDDRDVIARGTACAERAASSDRIEAIVAAIDRALDAASADLADQIGRALGMSDGDSAAVRARPRDQ